MKRILGLLLGLVLCTTLFAGCTSTGAWPTIKDNSGKITIAVIGTEKILNEREDVFKGIDMAVEEIKNTGIDIAYEKVYDNGSYDNGREVAKKVAEDSKYAIALTLQEYDVVDASASEFEKAKKPLIIIDGAKDSTMKKSYTYVLNDFMSGESIGNALGDYVINNGYEWVAGAHSDTSFEKSVMKGLNNRMTDSDSNVVDLHCGPSNAMEFKSAYSKWSTLGVDCVAISMEDTSWPAKLIALLKIQDPNLQIITDNIADWDNIVREYANILEGVVMVAPYPVKESESLTAFNKKYLTKYSKEATNRSVQGYDIIKMIIEKMKGTSSSLDFMNNMKSEKGFQGASTVLFNKDGTLKVSEYQYLKITNGTAVVIK